jgi:hypothetical protein
MYAPEFDKGAHFSQVTQGQQEWEFTTTTNTTTATETILDCFNQKQMSSLSMYQIGGWWDESHQVCKLATDGIGKKMQIRFRRDPTGKLDPAGKLKDPHKELRVQYKEKFVLVSDVQSYQMQIYRWSRRQTMQGLLLFW